MANDISKIKTPDGVVHDLKDYRGLNLIIMGLERTDVAGSGNLSMTPAWGGFPTIPVGTYDIIVTTSSTVTPSYSMTFKIGNTTVGTVEATNHRGMKIFRDFQVASQLQFSGTTTQVGQASLKIGFVKKNTTTNIAMLGVDSYVNSVSTNPVQSAGIYTYTHDAVKNITRSGTTFTATRLDNTTFTFTQQDTNYYHTTGSWNGLTYTATANGGAGALAFTIPTGTTSTTVARGDHTHTASSIGAAPLVRATDGTGKTKIGWLTFAKRTNIGSANALSSEIMRIDITRSYNSPGPETYSLLFQISYNTTGVSTAQVSFVLLNGTIHSTPIIKKIRCSKDITNHIAFLEIYVDPAYTTYENLTYINLSPMSGTSAEQWTPVTPYTIQTAEVITVAEFDLTSGTKLNNLNVIGTINGSELITYTATTNPTGAWKALGGRSSGFKLAIARWQSSPPAWTSGDYSSSLVFGGADTKGMLGLSYYSPTVTFGGGSVGSSTDAAPYWYFKIGAANGQTYLFPTTSKTLAASDGSNASGTWKIDVLPFNSGASGITSADSAWVTTTGQNKAYDNQSNKKWIWGARYTSSGWPNSDTGDMRFWLYGDSAGQWLNMNLDGYYFSIKGFIGDSSSATVGLSTAPMYAGYFTNLSANKITATEVYGDSIKAALGDYNGVVTYNADTNALSVDTTAAYDAWGKTSGGGLYYPSTVSQLAVTAGTVLITGSQASNLFNDGSDASDSGIVIIGDTLQSMNVSSVAAGTTTYVFKAAQNAVGEYPELYSKLSNLFSNIYYRTNAPESLIGQKPSSVSVASDKTIQLTFASSLNPSSSATRLKSGNSVGNSHTAITVGNGIYNNGINSLIVGINSYNTGAYSLCSGQAVYNDGATGSCLVGVRIYNAGNRSLLSGTEHKNVKVGVSMFGAGHDSTNGSDYVTAVGKYSLITSTTAFVVGGGTSVSARSNLFEVTTDGSAKVNGTAVSLNGHTHSYLPLSGGALTGDVTLATGKTIRPAAATNACSLGTASYPWNYVHTKGISITDAGEVALPFEGDGFLKYDQDSRLYLDNTAYATASHAHGNITSAGAVTATATIASGDRILITDSSASSKVCASGITFGTGTGTFLNNKGEWGTPGGTNAGHTHTLKITTVQGTNVTDLQSNTTYKLVVGNASYQFKTPTDYTCLAEGTKILMADNSEKNIEDVVAGDIIMSYDPNTEKLCEAVIIDNIHTGRSDDYVNYYFDDGSFLSIFGKHCIYSADEGTARGVDYWEPGWKTISADGKEVMYIGSENVHNAGRKRHFDLHSSNKLYFANGILNAQSLTLDYPMYKDDGLPEEYITALKADFDSSASLHTHQFDKKTGATLVPILKELKAQKKVMDDNKKRLADSDYLVAKFTEGLISAAEWLKAKAERAGWRSAVNKAEPLYAAAEERYNAFKAKYKAPNTKRERFNAAVARDNACLDALKAYYKSKNELSK